MNTNINRDMNINGDMNINISNSDKRKLDTKYMVELALMVAVTLVMSFTPLGYIRTPGLSVTLLTIPVTVSAIILGPVGGAVVGLTFGLTSFYNGLTGASAFTAALLNINFVGMMFTSIVPRVLEGLFTGMIFDAIHRIKPLQKFSYYIAALCCPLLNTVLFMSSLVIIFYNSDYIQTFVHSLGAKNPIIFIILFVGLQGLIEACICFAIASVVSHALYKALKPGL